MSKPTVVVKYGGSLFRDPQFAEQAADDLVETFRSGVRVLVVVGCGPRTTALFEADGKKVQFDQYQRRRTPRRDIHHVKKGASLVQEELSQAIERRGVRSPRVHGNFNQVFYAEVDRHAQMGMVGEIVGVNMGAYVGRDHGITVTTPLGFDPKPKIRPEFPVWDKNYVTYQRHPINLDGDSAAAELACAVRATHLVIATETPGLFVFTEDDPRNAQVRNVTKDELGQMYKAGNFVGGMYPKAGAVLRAAQGGVPNVIVTDGSPRSVIDAIQNARGATQIISAELSRDLS